MAHKTKDPDAVLDYGHEWALEPDETLTASVWAAPAGIILDSDTFQPSGRATVWLSGGEEGVVYRLINRITTSQGRTDEKTLRILVRNE